MITSDLFFVGTHDQGFLDKVFKSRSIRLMNESYTHFFAFLKKSVNKEVQGSFNLEKHAKLPIFANLFKLIRLYFQKDADTK